MVKIKKFIFDEAHYLLEDERGNQIRLNMYYAENRFEIEGIQSELAEKIAVDLLKKKHAVNFADKFAEYEIE